MSVFPRNTLFLFEIFEILWYNIYTKMRGEKKMIDNEFVNSALIKVASRFEEENYIALGYNEVFHDEEGEVHYITFRINEEIDTMLTGLNIPHCVEVVSALESSRFNIWVLCVSYVVDGKPYQFNLVVEER
jgi:hypothetical protein